MYTYKDTQLVIADPFLLTRSGHHLAYASSIKSSMQKLIGKQVPILGSKEYSQDCNVKDSSVLPYFNDCGKAYRWCSKPYQTMRMILFSSDRLRSELCRLIDELPTGTRLVLPSVTFEYFGALADVLAKANKKSISVRGMLITVGTPTNRYISEAILRSCLDEIHAVLGYSNQNQLAIACTPMQYLYLQKSINSSNPVGFLRQTMYLPIPEYDGISRASDETPKEFCLDFFGIPVPSKNNLGRFLELAQVAHDLGIPSRIFVQDNGVMLTQNDRIAAQEAGIYLYHLCYSGNYNDYDKQSTLRIEDSCCRRLLESSLALLIRSERDV